MKDTAIYYSVGALLYCPANNEKIAESVIGEKFGRQYSLALCLEDTINDSCVAEAENVAIRSIETIYRHSQKQKFYIPKIFIRIRTPRQAASLYERLGQCQPLLTGFIIPKFAPDHAGEYIRIIQQINDSSPQTVYMMPILESPSIVHLQERQHILYSLKEKLDKVNELVLNIRVGGNDLCNMFGVRRHDNESIHHIRPISDILSDIITVYGMDYVVSGPVWEYYNSSNWKCGLMAELAEDRLCGFIGKTVIHPNQIDIVNASYRVPQKDLDDAKAILEWNSCAKTLVSGSEAGERMNEYKTHSHWARKTLMLAEVYGVQPH